MSLEGQPGGEEKKRSMVENAVEGKRGSARDLNRRFFSNLVV